MTPKHDHTKSPHYTWNVGELKTPEQQTYGSMVAVGYGLVALVNFAAGFLLGAWFW